MKMILFGLLFAAVSSSAYAGLETLNGNFQSGPEQGAGCYAEFQIRVRQIANNEIVEFVSFFKNSETGTTSENVFKVFESINKGWVPWRYDWGDGIATGSQITTFEGTQLKNKIKVGLLGLRQLSLSLALEGSILTTTSTDTGSTPVVCKYHKHN